MPAETVECPHRTASTAVEIDSTKDVEHTTVSRTAVGVLPKGNLESATCPEGHGFYLKLSEQFS